MGSKTKVISLNNIHPTVIIGDQVKLGTNNTIGPYAVISGSVEIGDGNWIGPHTSIGGPPEIRGSDLPDAWENGSHVGTVTIGSQNVIREGCTIHAGYFAGTQIADDCYIMNQTYIAHDSSIGTQVTLSSHVVLGGHVVIQNAANLGMSAVVHQRRVIGTACMVGMGSIVTRDIPPFSKAFGNPCRIAGANVVGMNRMGLKEFLVQEISNSLKNSDIVALRRLIPNEMTAFEAAEASQQH
jgi:UDP-N-acetylglucosamine acyltransferase